LAERGRSALKLALNGSQDVFDTGRGGDGKGVIAVDIVGGVSGGDGRRVGFAEHIHIQIRFWRDGAGSLVNDGRHRLIYRVFVKVVNCHPVVHRGVRLMVVFVEGRVALLFGDALGV
jgi:hypothetical protein